MNWLELAARIGHDLCASAFRQGGRCSWVGRSMTELVPGTGMILPTVAAVGPDVYGGTAGIALFLGQLYAFTKDAETKETALQAIHHALDEAKRNAARIGFYSGSSGIAFAAARLSALLDTPALLVSGRYLLDRLGTISLADIPGDVASGSAGALFALLRWPESSRERRHLELAERLGGALAATAIAKEDTWAWSASSAMGKSSGIEASEPLVGLAHGASGMGLALLALHARTDNPRFAEVARGALAYERLVFDREERRWPDFRIFGERPAERRFASGWCYGAPGIALARRRALAFADDADWREDLENALSSSRREAAEEHEPGTDVTLCHGFASCLEPLPTEEAERAWAPLVERFGKSGDWPSGMPSRGPNPSLMLGTAGVGYTFLRMHDPSVPSVLLPL